jgi:hypothetical protein
MIDSRVNIIYKCKPLIKDFVNIFENTIYETKNQF